MWVLFWSRFLDLTLLDLVFGSRVDTQHESRAEWYLRQMLGAADFKAGPLLAFSSGNLCYQIEHHLFPDLPSNRYAQIAVPVQALCDK
jgi:NADPH-dependent stearoyl-CoA 9-desaturase